MFMAGISTSIQLADRMTPVLRSITNSMNIMLNSFHTANAAASAAFDTASMVAAQREIANASAELTRYQEELDRVSRTPVVVPEATWASASTPQVFMNTGAERFAVELQSANQMAQRLSQAQQEISAQARSLRVTPPGMLNDVAAVENRIQGLAARIEGLNSIPVELQTDRTNGELELMRTRLSQALDVQGSLNQAMGRMDISAANAAYQRLNSIIDSTEQGIRDNVTAQDQFNQSLARGDTAATGLEQTVKRVAAAVVSVATAGKIIEVADQVAQTAARIDLMNQKFGETGNLQQKIYESAQRSRGVYQGTADAVSKLGMQAGGAFANTNEVVAFAEQLNKTFVIAGTSAQGVDSVMLQLTQSMAAGKLQGEELNAVLDNAQPIVQNIADYMGVPVGQIKQLAAEGTITAEIIKNAMFAAADETDAKFRQMPVTFSQVASTIQNQALMAFQPALQQLSAVAQTAEFQSMVTSITNGIQMMAQLAVVGLDMMAQAAMWVQDNWRWLVPVVAGVTAAIAAYNIATGIQAFLTGASTLAVFLQIAAVQGLTAALAACPIMWIALVIGVVIAAIVALVNHFGGLQAAWLTCVNLVKTAADRLKLAFSFMSMHIQNVLANMQYAFTVVRVGILNALSILKINGLTIVESFLNGVIDRINRLIEFVNKIPGVSIQAIGKVELVADAAANEQVKMQQRSSDLAAMREENSAAAKARKQDYVWQSLQADAASDQRAWEARQAAKDSGASGLDQAAWNATSSSYSPAAAAFDGLAGGVGDIGGNTGNTAGNTAAMADSMGDLTDDLKYMRDAAEQEVINRFTLAELKVDLTNNNTLKTETDFEHMNGMLTEVTGRILAVAAEGGHL